MGTVFLRASGQEGPEGARFEEGRDRGRERMALQDDYAWVASGCSRGARIEKG